MDYVFYEMQRRRSQELTRNHLSGGRAPGQGDDKVNYQWSRRKLEFLERFMFGVTIDVILKAGNANLTNVMPGLRQATPGGFVKIAKSLLTSVPAERRAEFAHIWDILDDLKAIRNREAHRLEEMNTYTNAVEQAVTRLRNDTKAQFFDMDSPTASPFRDKYNYDYLLVGSPEDASEEYFCCQKFDSTGMADLVQIPAARLRRRADPIEGELYLRVTKRAQNNSTEYYRLSPFIQLFETDDRYVPVMYLETTRFLSGQMLMVHLYVTKAGEVDIECRLPSLLPQRKEDARYSQLTSSSNSRGNAPIEINLSKYPDFAKLRERDYQYCKSICPALEEAISFCKQDKDRSWGNYLIVRGEGGVGKTALVFYLINKIIIGGQTMFNRIIFLTAKKYFRFTDRPVEDEAQADEITPDICNYHELLERLSWLLSDDGKAVCKKDDDAMEAELLAQINGFSDEKRRIPNTFLVIDDLDSFSLEDQEKTIGFLNRLNGRRMIALLTTRNEKTSGRALRIDRLDKNQSMEFLQWCIEQRLPNQGGERCRIQNPDTLYQWTEGRALYIKLWGNLIIQGLSPIDDFPGIVTSGWRAIYLHRNTLKQLSPDEQQLFQIICGFNSAVFQDSDYKNERVYIMYQLLLYLMPERDTKTVDNCIIRLRDVQLIVTKQINLDNAFSEIDSVCIGDYAYTDLISQSQLAPLPEPVSALLENVRQASTAWRSTSRYMDQLINYLAKRLSEGHIKFELCIARRVLEVERENNGGKYLNKEQPTMIKGLIEQYDRHVCHGQSTPPRPDKTSNEKPRFCVAFETLAKEVKALDEEADVLSDEEFESRQGAIDKKYQQLYQETQNEEERDQLRNLRRTYRELF